MEKMRSQLLQEQIVAKWSYLWSSYCVVFHYKVCLGCLPAHPSIFSNPVFPVFCFERPGRETKHTVQSCIFLYFFEFLYFFMHLLRVLFLYFCFPVFSCIFLYFHAFVESIIPVFLLSCIFLYFPVFSCIYLLEYRKYSKNTASISQQYTTSKKYRKQIQEFAGKYRKYRQKCRKYRCVIFL